MSLARRHRERHAAISASKAAAPQGKAGEDLRPDANLKSANPEQEMMKIRLGVDLRRLSEIQSIERKIEVKRTLLPEYHNWVDGVLEADTGAADPVVSQVMIWSIDTGDFDRALLLADYVLRHNLALPERFDRTAGTLIVEEIAEAALKAIGQGEKFSIQVLLETERLGEDQDMPDEVRAKLMKALGVLFADDAEDIQPNDEAAAGKRRAGLDTAQSYLKRALELNDGCGVKKRLEKVQRELTRLNPPDDKPAN